MHHVESPAGLQHPGRLPRHVIQGAQHLMPGDGLGEIRVFQPVGVVHIGGIGGHHIKRSRAKNLTGFPDISLHNLNLFLQAVETHASPGHIRHFPLNLQGGKMLPLRLGLQENGNDPRPRPQIQGSLPLFHHGKAGEQHRIHPEAEAVRPLDDPVPVSLEIVHSLTFLQLHGHDSFDFPSFFSRASSSLSSLSLTFTFSFFLLGLNRS